MKKLLLVLPLALAGSVACVDRDRDTRVEQDDDAYVPSTTAPEAAAPATTAPGALPGRGEGELETMPAEPVVEPARPSDDQLEGELGGDVEMDGVEADLEGDIEGVEGIDDTESGHESP